MCDGCCCCCCHCIDYDVVVVVDDNTRTAYLACCCNIWFYFCIFGYVFQLLLLLALLSVAHSACGGSSCVRALTNFVHPYGFVFICILLLFRVQWYVVRWRRRHVHWALIWLVTSAKCMPSMFFSFLFQFVCRCMHAGILWWVHSSLILIKCDHIHASVFK